MVWRTHSPVEILRSPIPPTTSVRSIASLRSYSENMQLMLWISLVYGPTLRTATLITFYVLYVIHAFNNGRHKQVLASTLFYGILKYWNSTFQSVLCCYKNKKTMKRNDWKDCSWGLLNTMVRLVSAVGRKKGEKVHSWGLYYPKRFHWKQAGVSKAYIWSIPF